MTLFTSLRGAPWQQLRPPAAQGLAPPGAGQLQGVAIALWLGA